MVLWRLEHAFRFLQFSTSVTLAGPESKKDIAVPSYVGCFPRCGRFPRSDS